jgi:G3E family GTPase
VRAKGFFWLSTRPDYVGEMSQAGSFVRHHGVGRWWAAIPKQNWSNGETFDNMIKKYWTEDYGDRRQEIVFIGLKSQMDEQDISKRLDECLIDDYLDAPEVFQQIDDPFPKWFQQQA